MDRSVVERTTAYTGFRKLGEDARAVRVALWLAREYAEAVGNDPVSRGWLARAEGRCESACRCRTGLVGNLEAKALALLGLATIATGDVVDGMTRLDEAMVVCTGGEVDDPIVFGDVCCLVTRAAEEAGDASRLTRWNEIVLRSCSAPDTRRCSSSAAPVARRSFSRPARLP